MPRNTYFRCSPPQLYNSCRRPVQGPSFLISNDFVRGFKVQVSVVDPLGSPLIAQSVDKVYGTPQTDGTYKAYVLMYFTNTEPADCEELRSTVVRL